MRNSDIFDSFVKIAIERGIVSDKDKPLKEYVELMSGEAAPNATREQIAATQDLYGVTTPAVSGDLDYDINIIEVAHPNPVVIAPAYDKLNGLVENENERHNIIMNILSRTPTGVVTNHKYAEHELLFSLVKASNELAAHQKTSLKKLSDSCLEKVSSSKIKKVAVPVLALGLASLIGALYVQQHLPNVDEGFEANYARLISEVDDLVNSSSEWGVGVNYTPEFKKMIVDFKSKLNSINAAYQRVKPIIMDLDTPKDAEALKNLQTSPQGEAAIKAYEAFETIARESLKYVFQVQNNFKNEAYKSRQVQDKGFFNKLIDRTQVLHGGKGLIADNIDDVSNALDPFLKSIQSLVSLLQQAGHYEENFKRSVEEIASKEKEIFEPAKPDSSGTMSEHDERVAELDKAFSGK